MPMKYDKLFALMKEKGVSTYRVRQEKIVSEKTLQHLREGKSVETASLCRFCEVLQCQPCDIMEYVTDNE